jgi:hypothetical protein
MAIVLCKGIAKLRNPQRTPCRIKPAQQVAMLGARLGNRQRRQGESRKAWIDDRRHRKFCPGDRLRASPARICGLLAMI